MNLDTMNRDQVETFLSEGSGIVILPIGSTEAHGPHGPLGTDTFAAAIVAERVADLLEAVVAPALPYGMAADSSRFAGTISLRPTAMTALVRDICVNFTRDGYRLVLALSGHRGNDAAVMAALQEAFIDSNTHGLYMCYQDANRGRINDFLSGTGYQVSAEDERYGADGHGGSIELSLAMVYAPESVALDKRLVPDRTLADAKRSFCFRSVLGIDEYAPMEGVFGNPMSCSRDLGEQVARLTAEKIALDVKSYLDAFPKRLR